VYSAHNATLMAGVDCINASQQMCNDCEQVYLLPRVYNNIYGGEYLTDSITCAKSLLLVRF